MKFSFKRIIAVFIAVAFIYTACKKVGTAPSAPRTASEQQVAAVIAADFEASLSAKYGGVDLNNGIKPPSVITYQNKGKIVNSLSSLCGYTVDTTVSYHTHSGDTSSLVKGKFIFTFTCSSGSTYPDGYTVTTDLISAGKAPTYSFVYVIGQHYVVQSLDAQDTLVSLEGTLKSFGDYKYKRDGGIDTNYKPNPIFQHQKYVLTGLVIDVPDNLDILSGTATFTSIGNGSYGTWDYSGTITFIGNHKAIITIDGHSYSVDLITGVVTPI